MAGEVIVDALPYVDKGYDEPGVKDAALSLVEEETRRYRPTKNYLEQLAPANLVQFETSIMKSEFDRLASHQPMEMLNMKRYELPQPSAGKMTDLTAWVECVQNSEAQLEHQFLRIINLESMSIYACEAWKMHNKTLSDMIDCAQKMLVKIRKNMQEINWMRKNEQTEAGVKLKQLEENWVALVSKNYEIEQACVDMEAKMAMKDHQIVTNGEELTKENIDS